MQTLQPATVSETENLVELINNVSEIIKPVLSFEDFIIQQITPHLGAELSYEAVNLLQEIKNKQPDFRKFSKIYLKVENIEHRLLLKVVSAAYRLKYAQFHTDRYLSAIKSVIKYATACPHCGSIASNFITRLTEEGYYKKF